MKKIIYLAMMTGLVLMFGSCHDTVTYQEQRDREIAAINQYIFDSGIKVISEATFFAQDSTTDVSKNEFVLFEASGVYMQIVNKGCGEKLKNGETANVLCRFIESNLLVGADSVVLTNCTNANTVDKMSITKSSGTYYGYFDTSSSTMYYYHYMLEGGGSTSISSTVLSGWLVPFGYINLGRPVHDGDEIARVRLIVPHKQGHMTALSNVTPYLYDVTFERGR